MKYSIAPLFCRPWTLNGLSPQLIADHYETTYGNTVRRLNALSAQLDSVDAATTPPWLLGRLKQEQAAELNSALLHEIYFASLGGDGRAVPDALATAFARDFGSVDRWRIEFMDLAEGLADRPGWVVLSWLPRQGALFNQSVREADAPVAGSVTVLALDMYEHAYHQEFGANAAAYVAAFMRNIDWSAVLARYEDALATQGPRPLEQAEFAGLPAVTPDEVAAMLGAGADVQVIDVRPRHYRTRSSDIVDGAVWRDPERVSEWIGELSADKPVVTFCVYGFHIGCETAAALREAGFDASYMAGGYAAWKALKQPVRLEDGGDQPVRDELPPCPPSGP